MRKIPLPGSNKSGQLARSDDTELEAGISLIFKTSEHLIYKVVQFHSLGPTIPYGARKLGSYGKISSAQSKHPDVPTSHEPE